MATTNTSRLADYADRLRRLHNTVCPLLPADEQDELLELAVAVSMLASIEAQRQDGPACWCGHPSDRHRDDPIVCLDCWHTPSPPDSTLAEHAFDPSREVPRVGNHIRQGQADRADPVP